MDFRVYGCLSHGSDLMSEHLEFDSRSQKTFKSYVTGFILSIILTVFAFVLVKQRFMSDSSLYFSLALLAIMQLIVQSMCFLRLNSGVEGRWSLMPFLFAIFVIVILVGGSLWIMYNLNYNMMH